MVAAAVPFTQHVEQEGVNVIVQGLVVQEQLGQQAQVLAVHLCLSECACVCVCVCVCVCECACVVYVNAACVREYLLV
jgi:hypothetical protein